MAEQNIVFTSKEEEKIRIFKDTYNALYVRDFTDDKLNKLKSELNPVYGKLINNLKLPHSYKVDYIEGPVSLVKFKMEEGGKPKKSFYIFGEEHKDTRGNCRPPSTPYIEFHEYLYRLSQESPSFFDVYIESPMVKAKREFLTPNGVILVEVMKIMYGNQRVGFQTTYNREKNKLIPSDSYMFDKMEERFKTCFQPKTRNVPECDIMRIHNIDIRMTWDLDNFTPDLGLLLIDAIIPISSDVILYKNSTPEKIMHVLRRVSKGNTLILDTLNMMKTGDLMKVLEMNTRLLHEIDLSYEKDNIKNFIKRKLDEFNLQFIIDKSTILIDSIQDKTAPMLSLHDLREFQEICSLLNVLKADMYCLSRVFKTYNIKKNNPVGAFQPVESKNIIMYVGDDHAENYIEFLNYLGTLGRNVKSTYSSKFKNNVSCVRLREPEPKSKKRAEPEPEYKKQPPISEEERNERIQVLESLSIGTLRYQATIMGLNIQPRMTRKQLIALLFPFLIPDAIQEDTDIEEAPLPRKNQLPPVSKEERNRMIKIIENLDIMTLKTQANNNGFDIKPSTTRKQLIEFLIQIEIPDEIQEDTDIEEDRKPSVEEANEEDRKPSVEEDRLRYVSEEERNEIIKILENLSFDNLKLKAERLGIDIQPRMTKKQLLALLFPILIPPVDPEEERKKQTRSELEGFSYISVRAIAKRNGIVIPRYASKKKLIELLIESGY